MKNENGFTLIELIIVIAIMSILAMIAVPALQTLMVKNRLNGAARIVMSDLMAAKMKASNENNRYRVLFLDNHRYKTLDDNNSNNVEDTGEPTTIRDIQTEYRDVTFSATANPIFYPSGTAYGTTITLSSTGGTKTVSVSTAGRVKIN